MKKSFTFASKWKQISAMYPSFALFQKHMETIKRYAKRMISGGISSRFETNTHSSRLIVDITRGENGGTRGGALSPPQTTPKNKKTTTIATIRWAKRIMMAEKNRGKEKSPPIRVIREAKTIAHNQNFAKKEKGKVWINCEIWAISVHKVGGRGTLWTSLLTTLWTRKWFKSYYISYIL